MNLSTIYFIQPMNPFRTYKSIVKFGTFPHRFNLKAVYWMIPKIQVKTPMSIANISYQPINFPNNLI